MDCGPDGFAEIYCYARDFDLGELIADLEQTRENWRCNPNEWVTEIGEHGGKEKNRPDRVRWYPRDKRTQATAS